jgi:hypothetical protein
MMSLATSSDDPWVAQPQLWWWPCCRPGRVTFARPSEARSAGDRRFSSSLLHTRCRQLVEGAGARRGGAGTPCWFKASGPSSSTGTCWALLQLPLLPTMLPPLAATGPGASGVGMRVTMHVDAGANGVRPIDDLLAGPLLALHAPPPQASQWMLLMASPPSVLILTDVSSGGGSVSRTGAGARPSLPSRLLPASSSTLRRCCCAWTQGTRVGTWRMIR